MKLGERGTVVIVWAAVPGNPEETYTQGICADDETAKELISNIRRKNPDLADRCRQQIWDLIVIPSLDVTETE